VPYVALAEGASDSFYFSCYSAYVDECESAEQVAGVSFRSSASGRWQVGCGQGLGFAESRGVRFSQRVVFDLRSTT